MTLGIASMIGLSVAMRKAIEARKASSPTRIALAPSRAQPRQKTLADFMSERYGWKPAQPDAAKPIDAKPSAPKAPAAAPVPVPVEPTDNARELAEAVKRDDVCAVAKLADRASHEALVAAFLERGNSRMLSANDEDALRELLEPHAKRAQGQAVNTSSFALRFLDALEQAGDLGPRDRGAVRDISAISALADEDRGNSALAFFALPALLAATDADLRAIRYDLARAFRSPRFETGLPESYALLARQGAASSSHYFLWTKIGKRLPWPRWNGPVQATIALLKDDDPSFREAALEFGDRLAADALRIDRGDAVSRAWANEQLIAGESISREAWALGRPGEPPPDPTLRYGSPDEPEPDLDPALRALKAADCDRSPFDRATIDAKARSSR